MARIQIYTPQVGQPSSTNQPGLSLEQSTVALEAKLQQTVQVNKMVDSLVKAEQEAYAMNALTHAETQFDEYQMKAIESGDARKSGYAKQSKEYADAALNAALDNISDPDVKRSFFAQAGQVRRGFINQASKVEYGARLEAVEYNATQAFNTKANQLARQPQNLDANLIEADEMVAKLQPALGKRADQMGFKIKNELVVSALAPQMRDNPAAVQKAIESGKYDNYLLPQQTTSLLNRSKIRQQVGTGSTQYTAILGQLKTEQQQLLKSVFGE